MNKIVNTQDFLLTTKEKAQITTLTAAEYVYKLLDQYDPEDTKILAVSRFASKRLFLLKQKQDYICRQSNKKQNITNAAI